MENNDTQQSFKSRTKILGQNEQNVSNNFSKNTSKSLDNSQVLDYIQPTNLSKTFKRKITNSKHTDFYNSFKEIDPGYEPNFEMVPYRWVILVLFCSYLFSVALNATFIQPVSYSMTKAYHISNTQVNLCITMFSLANVLNTLFAFYFVEKMGTKHSITISLALFTIANGIN